MLFVASSSLQLYPLSHFPTRIVVVRDPAPNPPPPTPSLAQVTRPKAEPCPLSSPSLVVSLADFVSAPGLKRPRTRRLIATAFALPSGAPICEEADCAAASDRPGTKYFSPKHHTQAPIHRLGFWSKARKASGTKSRPLGYHFSVALPLASIDHLFALFAACSSIFPLRRRVTT